MPVRKKSLLTVAFGLVVLPTLVFAQAAVTSDQPIARSGGAAGLGSSSPIQGTGLDSPASRSTPNTLTGPGSPGKTGTGAAGTGPTETIAAPGR